VWFALKVNLLLLLALVVDGADLLNMQAMHCLQESLDFRL
jgi:hypothetical protein